MRLIFRFILLFSCAVTLMGGGCEHNVYLDTKPGEPPIRYLQEKVSGNKFIRKYEVYDKKYAVWYPITMDMNGEYRLTEEGEKMKARTNDCDLKCIAAHPGTGYKCRKAFEACMRECITKDYVKD